MEHSKTIDKLESYIKTLSKIQTEMFLIEGIDPNIYNDISEKLGEAKILIDNYSEKLKPEPIINNNYDKGGLDKYFEDLDEYHDSLYCTHCGNEDRKTFTYSRTVANSDVFFCHVCKEENPKHKRPNEDDY